MKAPTILYIGLPHTSKHIPPSAPPREVLQKLLTESTQAIREAGYDAESFWFEPEDIDQFQEKLKEKNWDGVIIGNGVRSSPDLTEFFEKLVNLVKDYDSNIKLGFNTTPNDTPDTARRMFPQSVQSLAKPE